MIQKLYILTSGCQMNEYDSDKMRDVLKASHGVEQTDNPQEADILLLNTCSIREKAQEKVFSSLGRWKKIKEKSVALVLLDLILPGIQGYEVLSKIKKDSATSTIPVVIISNLGQKEEIERGLELGAVDFLIKAHFTPDDIINKVKAALK